MIINLYPLVKTKGFFADYISKFVFRNFLDELKKYTGLFKPYRGNYSWKYFYPSSITTEYYI